MTHTHAAPEAERTARLVTRLTHGFHDRSIRAAYRWTPGIVDARVIELTAAAEHPQEVDAFSTTAAAFAVWHSGRAAPHRGRPTTSLGRAMRQIGRGGGYGPRDPQARRLLDRLLGATTYPALHDALIATTRALSSADHPPSWALLAQHLTEWQTSPTERDRIRFTWARDFHTATDPNSHSNSDNDSDPNSDPVGVNVDGEGDN